jgi:acyl-CoA thioesterase-2
MLTLTALREMARFREVGGQLEADTVATAHGAIFGAYTMFQQVLVAERAAPGKRVLSLQTLFANGGVAGQPIQIDVDVLQQGRSFSCLSVTFRQAALVISRAEVLLTSDEDDYLRWQSPAPALFQTEDWLPRSAGLWPGRTRRDPSSGLEAVTLALELDEPVAEAGVARALVALATEPEVMNALLEYGDVTPAANGGMPANVLTTTVTLLEPADFGQPLIVRAAPTYAGQGRAHGGGAVLAPSGALLASYTSTGVLRRPRS